MPVSHAVMVEGFLQITSEARLSVKQLCKALIQQGNDERWPVAGREGACFFFYRPRNGWLSAASGGGVKTSSKEKFDTLNLRI